MRVYLNESHSSLVLFTFHERDLTLMEYHRTQANSIDDGADNAHVLLGAATYET